jgi:hypothetical protein
MCITVRTPLLTLCVMVHPRSCDRRRSSHLECNFSFPTACEICVRPFTFLKVMSVPRPCASRLPERHEALPASDIRLPSRLRAISVPHRHCGGKASDLAYLLLPYFVQLTFTILGLPRFWYFKFKFILSSSQPRTDASSRVGAFGIVTRREFEPVRKL